MPNFIYGAPRASPWSKKHTHLRQPARRTATMAGGDFSGSSAEERNPPKRFRFIVERVLIWGYTFLVRRHSSWLWTTASTAKTVPARRNAFRHVGVVSCVGG